jgi:glutamate/tyrosine decarboxylase-like PLP-dependent enzyme
MALHKKLIEELQPLVLSPMYARPGEAGRAPRHSIPDLEMAPDTAYQLIRDELMLDGNARHGWLVPAYTFPENRQDLAVLRVVVRNGFSRDLADLLVSDLQRHARYLDQLDAPLPSSGRGEGFKH